VRCLSFSFRGIYTIYDIIIIIISLTIFFLPTRFSTEEIRVREKTLLPLYTQIAHEFADLHDRAGRMKAKGCITDVLEWRTARSYFYWRIRRRQLEDGLKERLVQDSAGTLTLKQAAAKVRRCA